MRANRTIPSRLPALICASLLLLCLPLIRPWLGTGIFDEPSYVRTAQMLAQTGHVIYNGWSGPILGWHLYLGAAFIRLFGFSFTVVRLSTLPVAMLMTFLGQRTMLRAGLSQWNATLAILAFILTPLFLPLSFSYMTDVGGMLVVILCFYGCLRAIEAESDRDVILWLAFSAIANAVGGSIRQTCWLGLLVMIPSALWLLRKRRAVFIWGCISLFCGLAIMAIILEWHKNQPFTISTSLISTKLTGQTIGVGIRWMAGWLFDAPLFLLPMLIPFLAAVRWHDRRSRLLFLFCAVVSIGAMLYIFIRADSPWLLPTTGDIVTLRGVANGANIQGDRPIVLHNSFRSVLTACVFLALCGFFAAAIPAYRARRAEGDDSNWRMQLILILPFSVVYVALVATQAPAELVYDRYLLPLLFFALLLLARFYQDRISPRLPAYVTVFIALFAIYGIATTHDAFAMFRAIFNAANEVRQSGVSAGTIDGGWEFDSWTELERAGYLPWPSVKYPPGMQAYKPEPMPELSCAPHMRRYLPLLHPEYAVSFDPGLCSGQSTFAPVTYRTWLPPRTTTLYVVRVEPVTTTNASHSASN